MGSAMLERIHAKVSMLLAPRTGEAGQGLAEYALILAFIALACVAALGAFGTAIKNSPAWTIFG